MTSFAKFWTVVTIAGMVGTGAVVAETARKPATGASHKQEACPVAMVAEQEAGIASEKEAGPAPKAMQPGPAHEIHFKLTNNKLGAIAAVELRVNGWNGVVHSVPLTTADAPRVTGWKMVDVKVSIGPRKTAETDVRVRGLTAVNSIDLMGVRYADGSNWKSAKASACSVTPDPTMLISQK